MAQYREDPRYDENREQMQRWRERDERWQNRRWYNKGRWWLGIGVAFWVVGLAAGFWPLSMVGSWLIVVALLVRTVIFIQHRIQGF